MVEALIQAGQTCQTAQDPVEERYIQPENKVHWPHQKWWLPENEPDPRSGAPRVEEIPAW